ncbi:MAG: tetratricopeptide repeat protein, partial [Myxococcales bacterium]|nr:tetratricopeptide repeat protein [Myxococcales bacterium]
ALEDGDAAGLDEARAWLERAARARPDYPKVPATQALLAAREGDTARALDAIERAHRLAPDDGEIATNHGALLIERGRLADARKVLEGALRRAPDDALATYNLALVDDLEGRVDRAAWGYGRFLTLSSQADPARAEVRARMQLLLGEVAADAAPAVSSAAPPSADDVAQTPDSENGSRAGAPSPESEGGTRR